MDLTRTSPPRILLVEDDAISRDVLAHAVRALPADLEAVATLAAARRHLSDCTFDAWLVDANLPDGDGRELLALRPSTTVAIAHTAATDAHVRQALLDAGFVDVLPKPIAAADLQMALRRLLARADAPRAARQVDAGAIRPVWDDAAALHALAGNVTHVRALRGLFIGELDAEMDALAQSRAAHDADAIRARVHRLRASCGFVGAARLAALLPRLDAAPFAADVFDALAHAARDTHTMRDPLAVDTDAVGDGTGA